jgi:ethanolamine ammonia-lyase small subunit
MTNPVRTHHVRRSLERRGWRTTLEYRENHVRAADGTLLSVEPCWIAEAERPLGGAQVAVATASAASQAEAWYRLRRAAAVRVSAGAGRAVRAGA